jgi:hypothetical protein
VDDFQRGRIPILPQASLHGDPVAGAGDPVRPGQGGGDRSIGEDPELARAVAEVEAEAGAFRLPAWGLGENPVDADVAGERAPRQIRKG